ncbi:hypothetical protein [Zhaonella formicivorans]|uniref:hypothetical protein n=1 Tax=Zhaonella formicivorans TaxID=2528593 RepID=UPI0010D9484A|nr:hypothetical protein [Zhaonella formicivorans]
MKLERGEHSILATFPNSAKAEAAKEALLTAGIAEVQLDRISRYGVNADTQYNNPIAGQADTQTGLTLHSADVDQIINSSSRILLSSDPSVSGYGLRDYGVPGNHAFMLTVVVNTSQLNQALKIIKEQGGEV